MKNSAIFYTPFRPETAKGGGGGIKFPVVYDSEPMSGTTGLNGLYGTAAMETTTLHHGGKCNLLLSDNSVFITPKFTTESVSNTQLNALDKGFNNIQVSEFNLDGTPR